MPTVESPSSMEAAALAPEDDLLPVSRNDLSKSAGKKAVAKKKPSLLGIGLLLLSGLLFTTVALFVKLLTATSAVEAAQARCCIQFVVALPFVLYYVDGSPLGPRDQLLWVFARAFFGIAAATCSYYAIKHMPIGDAIVLIFTSPVFTGIISRLVLKEPWGLWEAGASLLSITGVVFIARPPFLFGRITANGPMLQRNSSQISDLTTEQHAGETNLVAVGMALSAAVGMACALVAGRKASQKVHFLIITMYFGGVGTVFTSVIAIATQQFHLPYSLRESTYMLIIGGLAFLAQAALNKGLSLERAVIGALIRNMDVLLAFIFQVTVFSDSVTKWSALGTFFILSATLSITWRRYHEQLRTQKK